MRQLIIVFLFLLIGSNCFCQKKKGINFSKKLPNYITDADRRKVEKAKKLLNQGKVFEGEKALIDLRDQNMNHAYFHEALVQIQKQILDQIAFERPPDELEGEYFLYGKDLLKPDLSLEENFISNGLARTKEEKKETVDNIRLAIRDKKRLKRILKNMKDEAVEKDSVLNPIEAAKKEIDKENNNLRKKENEQAEQLRLEKKNAKKEKDIFLIPYKSYAYQVISTSRLASLKHERVDSSSHYLRILTIDTIRYDTLLTMGQIDTFAEALDYYYHRDYTRSANLLKTLTAKHLDYFPAQDYLGRAYFKMGLDTPTYNQFVYLAQTFEYRPEGLLGLSRYFLAKGKYKKAAASIIKAIAIYPEDAYFVQLDNILKRDGKRLKTQWIRREVYPVTSAKNYVDIIAKEKSLWRYYQNAGAEMHSYASPEGILRGNEITRERYLELYAWKEMLKEHDELALEIKDPKKRAEYLSKNNQGKKKKDNKISFPFARSMQKMGLLDCYVFITLFHNDLYPAFKEFVRLNPDKVEQYFNVLLNWEDKKFDKYRIVQAEDKEKKEKKKKSKKKKK